MPIPDNINAKHVLEAIAKIDIDGVPGNRKSTKYFLQKEGRLYPPKYAISLANYFANGEMLSANPQVFNTYQAQSYLESMDFEVIVKKARKRKA